MAKMTEENIMISTDQQLDIKTLSNAGQLLVKSRDEVLTRWTERIRAELKHAQHLRHPILVDTIPAFIDNLAEAMTPNYPRPQAGDFSTVAREHGDERARVTQFNPDDVIREYHALQDVIFECLKKQIELSSEERLVIRHSIGEALRESVTAFALAQADLREKFIANLTHDLRHPISVISLAADLMRETLDNKSQTEMLLNRITKSAKRADEMIRNLLDASVVKSVGRPKLEIQDGELLSLITSVTTDLSSANPIEKTDRFKIVGTEVPGYWCLESLRRSIENLCSNAIKYGESETPVTIQVTSAQGRAIISVHNHGPAIPIEEQETIFQVFRRAKKAKDGDQKGWGLGLSFVRGVCESHGGSLIVDSSEGRGTTFMIDIPQDSRPFQNITNSTE